MSMFCDLCCIVIADVWVKGRDQHKRVVQQLADPFPVWFDASDTVLGEREAGISKQTDGLKYVPHHHGLEDVQFKVSVTSSDGHSNMVAHHLGGDHRQSFTLSWVDFSWEGETYVSHMLSTNTVSE